MLFELLSQIVSREYEQWLRYTYLSSLGFGLHTDVLSCHFREHGSDELEHARIISRWLVDLGEVPPTHMEPVEQFCGSTEDAIKWLLQYEQSGIDLYCQAHEYANQLCIPGLVEDLGDIISTEREHISDLLKMLVNPEQKSPMVIIVADKEAQSPPIQPNADPSVMLREGLENAAYTYGHKYDPQKGYQHLLENIETSVKMVWEFHRDDPDARTSLQIYKNTYEWLKNPSVVNNWDALHEAIWPESKQWMSLADEEEVKQETAEPTMQDIWQQMEPSGYKAPAQPQPQAEPEVAEDDDMKELMQTLTPRRPAEEALKDKIEVADPRSKRKFQVGVGDRIRNKTLTTILKQEKTPGPSWPVTKMSLGTINEVGEDFVRVTTDTGEEDTWYPEREELEIDVKERPKYLGREALRL